MTIKRSLLFVLALALAAFLACTAAEPGKLSEPDQKTYLAAALKLSRAETAESTAAAKYFEAEKAAKAAASEFAETIRKLQDAAKCAGCKISDPQLTWIRPPK